MKYKNILSVLVATFFATVAVIAIAHAGFDIPIPLPIINKSTDKSDNVYQQLLTLKDQYEKLERQVELLENQLKYFDGLQDMEAIGNTLKVMTGLKNAEWGIWDRGKWREKYKNDEELEETVGKGSDAALTHARDLLNATDQAIADAVEAQGYALAVKEDADALGDLVKRTDNEDVNLTTAVKLGNHIAALEINQLMRLQYLQASSLHLQSLIYAQQVQSAKMNEIMHAQQQFVDFPAENPLADGPGEYRKIKIDTADGE